jgi:hypothetical protein
MKTAILTLTMLVTAFSSYAIDANDRHGISGITMSINTERIHRSGEEAQFNLVIVNNNSKDENGVGLSFMDSKVFVDGEDNYPIDGNVNYGSVDLPAGESTAINTWISRIPLNAEKITSINIVGRAPNSSKSNSNNPYGDYVYKFTDIVLPSFPESNIPGCVFHDNEISLQVGNISANGKDLVVEFMLTNNGHKDYTIDVADYGRGVARTVDGEEYEVATKFPKNLPVGEAVKGQLVITDGADEKFATVRQSFDLSQNRNYWKPGLLLRNISKQP